MEFVLGLQVAQSTSNRTAKLVQTRYILDMLDKFDMSHVNHTPASVQQNSLLTKSQCPKTGRRKWR